MGKAVLDLRGKVVLVTGASSGIGGQTALAFDRRGARVAMAARRADRLEMNAALMTDALVLPADLSDPAQAEASSRWSCASAQPCKAVRARTMPSILRA